jgi:hypothetical protein
MQWLEQGSLGAIGRWGLEAALGGISIGATGAGRRVRLDADELTLDAGRGKAELSGYVDPTGLSDRARLLVDIYSTVHTHPEKHLGWWLFPVGERRGRVKITSTS